MSLPQVSDQDLGRLARGLAVLRTEARLLGLHLRLKAGFRPDQPRVPAGDPDGGQWTEEGGSVSRVSSSTRGGTGASGTRIGARRMYATPGQLTRLEISHLQMQAALQQVRRLDPRWRSTPQAYETVEGQISANLATAREAQGRLDQLREVGIGLGRFAGESLPARDFSRNFTKWERMEISRIGRSTGCHTCGTKEPGTRLGYFVLDHQLPSAMSPARQSLFPHCLRCSLRQGAWITNNYTRKLWMKFAAAYLFSTRSFSSSMRKKPLFPT